MYPLQSCSMTHTDLDIQMRAIVYASAPVRTVGQLRELIAWCDKHGVKDEGALDWGLGQVHIDITESANASWIADGDSPPKQERYDVLVSMRR
jgi:hypothetical protein